MLPELKLVISFNDKIVQTETKEISELGFVKSIEDFQAIANASLTKLIEDSGNSEELNMEEEDESDSVEADDCVFPKKKKI